MESPGSFKNMAAGRHSFHPPPKTGLGWSGVWPGPQGLYPPSFPSHLVILLHTYLGVI